MNAPSQFRTVLVTTDFSPLADRALPFAPAMLAGHGCIHLVHVTHPLALPAGEFLQGSWNPAARRRQQRHLTNCRKRLAVRARRIERRNLVVRPELVLDEDVPHGILAAAARTGAEAIILSSHGRTGLPAAVLGSIARRLVAAADRPVLLVRGPA